MELNEVKVKFIFLIMKKKLNFTKNFAGFREKKTFKDKLMKLIERSGYT